MRKLRDIRFHHDGGYFGQYFRGLTVATRTGQAVEFPHLSGRRLGDAIVLAQVFRTPYPKAAQSRRKREPLAYGGYMHRKQLDRKWNRTKRKAWQRFCKWGDIDAGK